MVKAPTTTGFAPATVSENRVAVPGFRGVAVVGNSSVVSGNVIGVGSGGQSLQAGAVGLLVVGINGMITANTIGNATGGSDFIGRGMVLDSGGQHVIKGNLIGTDALGNPHPNEAAGLEITGVDNGIGGPGADQNVISNSGAAAISVLSGTGNGIHENRGRGNGGPFIDLGG